MTFKYFRIKEILTLGSGIISPSLINAAKPSSCENAYAERLSDRVDARTDERGCLTANMVDFDLGGLMPYFCTILTLSDIVGHMSSLTKRYAIMGKSNTADVIRAVNQNMAVEHTA